MARLECITFDLDDTLWDHRRAEAEALEEIFGSLLRGRMGAFVERFHLHNRELWRRYRVGEVDADTVRVRRIALALADVGADPRLAGPLSRRYLEHYSGLPYLRPGALEALALLSRSLPLGCLTDGFAEAQRRKLEAGGILGYFRFVVTSEEVGAAKPAAAIYRAAAAAAGSPPGRIVHVGDSYETDVVGALAQGFRVAWVPLSPDARRPRGGPVPDWQLAGLWQLPAALGVGPGPP